MLPFTYAIEEETAASASCKWRVSVQASPHTTGGGGRINGKNVCQREKEKSKKKGKKSGAALIIAQVVKKLPGEEVRGRSLKKGESFKKWGRDEREGGGEEPGCPDGENVCAPSYLVYEHNAGKLIRGKDKRNA